MFPQINDDELITLDELCERLFIGKTTAFNLLRSGEINAFKLGTWKIPVTSVREYVQRQCDKQAQSVKKRKRFG